MVESTVYRLYTINHHPITYITITNVQDALIKTINRKNPIFQGSTDLSQTNVLSSYKCNF